MALDLNLIRRAAVTSHGGRSSIPRLTTRQANKAAALMEALASGSATSGEDLNTEDGDPVFIFALTPMVSPYVVH